jgi:ATP-dependent Clp protease ATP-binding subunit ClpC
MQLSNQEAQRFNHEYIGTEHLLLGLIKEGTGVGANVLTNLKADLKSIRLQTERLVKPGPEMITMGKLPQTPRTKKVIEYSMEAARELGHNFVGTEHLLLGLLREKEGIASEVLRALDIEFEEAQEGVLNLLGRGREEVEVAEPKLADRSKHMVETRSRVKPKDRLAIWSRSLTDAAGFQREDQRQPLDDECFSQIVHALLRRRKNNVLLVGDIMVTHEYARMIGHVSRHGPLPSSLREIDVREFLPSAGNMQTTLPARIMHCLNESVQHGNVILIIDQIETAFQTRVETRNEKLGVLTRPWLRTPNVRCVGLIDTTAFESSLETDAHVFDDFTVVKVPPFNIDQINAAVVARLDDLEEHHICSFSNEAVKIAVQGAMHYEPDEFAPEEVDQLLDHAAALLQSTVAAESEEIQSLDEELKRIIRHKSAAVTSGNYERAFAKEEKFLKLRKKRIELNTLPEVTLDHVIQAIAETYSKDVESIRKELA